MSGYFTYVETLFDQSGIQSEQQRHTILMTSVGKHRNILKKVRDTLQNTNSATPYTQMRDCLLERFTLHQSDSLRSLLYDCTRGDDSVTEDLLRLRSLLGDRYSLDSSLCF